MLHLHAAILLVEVSWQEVLDQPLPKESGYYEFANQEAAACFLGSFARNGSWLQKAEVEVASDSCGVSACIFCFPQKPVF